MRYEEDDGRACCGESSRGMGGRPAFPGAEEACDLLASLPASDLFGRRRGGDRAGRRRAWCRRSHSASAPADGALLHQAHRSSDWVITVDRTLGMEYFDSPGSTRRPDYVIDFEGSDATAAWATTS